jgi:hypothetical protein
MKKNIKYMLGFALCAGLMQPQMQAMNPLRKWVAGAATVASWYLLAQPAVDVLQAAIETKRVHLHLCEQVTLRDRQGGVHVQHRYPNFKDAYPAKYQAVNQILKKEGLKGLDDYTIKVLNPQELALNHLGQSNPASAGDKILILPSQYTGTVHLSEVDNEGLAAVIAHEIKHDEASHQLKKFALVPTTPLILEGAYQKIVSSKSKKVGSYPTITRSLLRIPRAYAILGLASLIRAQFGQQCEYEADTSVKKSSLLSFKLAEHLEEDAVVRQKEYYENQEKKYWLALLGRPIALTPRDAVLLLVCPSASCAVNAEKFLDDLTGTHPTPEKRIERIKRWVNPETVAEQKIEAEKKRQQKEAERQALERKIQDKMNQVAANIAQTGARDIIEPIRRHVKRQNDLKLALQDMQKAINTQASDDEDEDDWLDEFLADDDEEDQEDDN